MIGFRSDSDNSPTPLLIFTQASNISKFGQILVFEVFQFLNNATRLKFETTLKVAMTALSPPQTRLRSLPNSEN